MDDANTDDVSPLCAVLVSSPCHVIPQSSVNADLLCNQSLGCTNISLGENYTQTEHVRKLKRVTFSRHLRSLAGIMTGSDRHGEMRLRQAIRGEQHELVQSLLDDGVDPCCMDEKHRSPLHIAAASGSISIVKMLLASGANPNQKDVIGNTALHLAACSNNIPVVTALLQSGTDVNSLDQSGRSPLHLALGRLRLLHKSDRYTSDQLRTEVVQIINMLQVYMTSVKLSRRTDDNKTNDVMSELDCLSKQLEQTTTVDDIDTVGSLLSDLARLQIEQMKS